MDKHKPTEYRKENTSIAHTAQKGAGMRKVTAYKPCPRWPKERCFAVESGGCSILNDTNFSNKKCPFFKTKAQFLGEERTERN